MICGEEVHNISSTCLSSLPCVPEWGGGGGGGIGVRVHYLSPVSELLEKK